MRSSMRVLMVSLAAAAGACSAGGAGGAPPPNPNVWVASAWTDSTGGPMATAYRGTSDWINARLQGLAVDTTKDSVAHATFQFAIHCDGCLFYFRDSRAVDDRGRRWDVSDMPQAPHPGPNGFGWRVGPGSRQLFIVYSTPMAGRRRPAALSLIIRSVTGFRGMQRDPLHPTRQSPEWDQDLTFDPVRLDWSTAGVGK
jgi:hypothetical protein